MRRRQKGSFTVEAALLQGMILLVIFLIIALYWYLHNKIWFTAAACEAAMTGSMEASWNADGAEGVVEEKLLQVKANQAFPCEELKLNKQVGKSSVQVQCQGKNSAVLGGWKGTFLISETSEITRPTEYIRRVRMLAQLAG